jgi:hypothetical protein
VTFEFFVAFVVKDDYRRGGLAALRASIAGQSTITRRQGRRQETGDRIQNIETEDGKTGRQKTGDRRIEDRTE